MSSIGTFRWVSQDFSETACASSTHTFVTPSKLSILFWQARFELWVLGILGALPLVLAAVGMYGVLTYHVSPLDAVTWLSAVDVWFVVALLACWLPARCGTRVEPLVALREE